MDGMYLANQDILLKARGKESYTPCCKVMRCTHIAPWQQPTGVIWSCIID